MALSTNIRNANLGYSLNDPADTWAERTDIKEAAQYRLSNSIAEATGSAVAKVKQLESYYFYFNEDGKAFGFDRPEDSPNGIQPKRIGLIAQELMAIEPSLVRKMDWLDLGPEDPEYYWVDYDAMYVLILDAMNELKLFINNDEDLYRRSFMPIIQNIKSYFDIYGSSHYKL